MCITREKTKEDFQICCAPLNTHACLFFWQFNTTKHTNGQMKKIPYTFAICYTHKIENQIIVASNQNKKKKKTKSVIV
jgi:hypothetical protein